ncbi:MAG: aromatic ring hydroxylase [Thermoprotei archaeon]|nr:MAG: aromatic ring hydroxylase [Thermoprotei archaeon]
MVTKEDVIKALKKVYDPEIPVNIVDLGLIYGIEIKDNSVNIKMTMTAPGCPLGFLLVDMVKEAVKEEIPSVKEINVKLVWDPPWTPERMSEEAKRLLGFK